MHTIAVLRLKVSFLLVQGCKWNPPFQVFFLGRRIHLESLAWVETSLALSQPTFLVHLAWTQILSHKQSRTKCKMNQNHTKRHAFWSRRVSTLLFVGRILTVGLRGNGLDFAKSCLFFYFHNKMSQHWVWLECWGVIETNTVTKISFFKLHHMDEGMLFIGFRFRAF